MASFMKYQMCLRTVKSNVHCGRSLLSRLQAGLNQATEQTNTRYFAFSRQFNIWTIPHSFGIARSRQARFVSKLGYRYISNILRKTCERSFTTCSHAQVNRLSSRNTFFRRTALLWSNFRHLSSQSVKNSAKNIKTAESKTSFIKSRELRRLFALAKPEKGRLAGKRSFSRPNYCSVNMVNVCRNYCYCN